MAVVGERLKEAGLQVDRVADRHGRLPFAAEAVQLRRVHERGHAEARGELKVRAEVEAELEIRRAPGLRRRRDLQDAALAVRDDGVADDLEVAQRIDALQVLPQRLRVEDPRLRMDEVIEPPLVDARNGIDHDLVDVRQRRQRRVVALLPRGVLALGHGPLLELALVRFGGLVAERNHLQALHEVGRGVAIEVGRDHEGRELRRGHRVLLERQVDEAADHRAHVLGFGRRLGARRAHVDRDDDVGAHREHRLHRKVLGLAAVDEHVAVDLDRRESRGNGHARPDDAGEISARHDVGLARLDVGRHRLERDAQLGKVRHRGAGHRRGLEHEAELAARDQARRQQEPALLQVQAELERDQPLEVVFLLPERLVLALGSVAEERVPGNRADELLHLVGRVAAGVEAADDRAHARACHVVDRDVQLFEQSDDADVRRAPRAAAAEREADLRTRGRRLLRRRFRRRRCLERPRDGQQAQSDREEGTKSAKLHGGEKTIETRPGGRAE